MFSEPRREKKYKYPIEGVSIQPSVTYFVVVAALLKFIMNSVIYIQTFILWYKQRQISAKVLFLCYNYKDIKNNKCNIQENNE